MLMMPMFKGVSVDGEGSWDITTAEYTGNSFDIAGQEGFPQGLFFSPDGLNMFVVGIDNDTVFQYTLSSAFDITTASYTGNSFFIGTQDTNPTGVFFSPDGLNMFVVGNTNDAIFQYTLSSAFDITTASYTGNSFFIGTQDTNPTGVFFSPDGLNMFVIGLTEDNVHQYILSSAFDITTTTYTGNSFSINGQEPTARGLSFSPDGLNMFVVGNSNDIVFQYTLS